MAENINRYFKVWEQIIPEALPTDVYIPKTIKYPDGVSYYKSPLNCLFCWKHLKSHIKNEEDLIIYGLGPSFTKSHKRDGYVIMDGQTITAKNLFMAKNDNKQIFKVWLYAYLHDHKGPLPQGGWDLYHNIEKEIDKDKNFDLYCYPQRNVCIYGPDSYLLDDIYSNEFKNEYHKKYGELRNTKTLVEKAAVDYKRFVKKCEIWAAELVDKNNNEMKNGVEINYTKFKKI